MSKIADKIYTLNFLSAPMVLSVCNDRLMGGVGGNAAEPLGNGAFMHQDQPHRFILFLQHWVGRNAGD